MNRVILCGRLTREPEVRYSQTANGSMANRQQTLLTVSHLARMESLRRSIFIRGLRLSLRVDGRQAITLTRTDRKSTLMIALLKDMNFVKVVLISRTIITMELWAVMLVQTALCQFQMA